ncbi:hypothetical protein LZU85_14700 [Vibrio sp. IRLE0018]|uniref:hypothetical protein n=1 Tax=Vibrio floridensis TaxID=2908007 RepID=UPI001F2DEFD3|nr:hypothetical protein [Vibrio floridensis]MCF8780054.1 hypothetical protein [Vibrio floridensis]
MKDNLLSNFGYINSFVYIFNLIVIGVFASLFNIPQLYWLGVMTPFLLLFSRENNIQLAFKRDTVWLFVWFVYLFVFCFLFNTPISLKMVAVKDYILPTLSLLVLVNIGFGRNQLEYFYRLIRLILFIQLPFLCYQFLFLARNVGDRAFDWDLMTGTFGFNSEGGGGNSAGLLLFLCYFVVLCVSRIRGSQHQSLDFLALICASFCLFLIETKIIFLLVFLILLHVVQKNDWIRPAKLILAAIITIALLYSLLTIYSKVYVGENSSVSSVSDYIEQLSGEYVDTEVIDYETGEVSRQAAMDIWIGEKYEYGIDFETLVGVGLTSSKAGNYHIMEAASYGSLINFASTQITTYLWDVGVIGVVILCVLYIATYIKLLRYISRVSPMEESFIRASLFVITAIFIYPFYSLSLHLNSINLLVVGMPFLILSSIGFNVVFHDKKKNNDSLQ